MDIFTRVSDYEESGTDTGSNDPGFPLRVSVQRRPILLYDGSGGGLHVRSTWRGEPAGRQDIDLMLRAKGRTWYWSGNLIRQGIPSPRPSP
ncbi:MAG: hypothetical protein M3O91_05360 [Chloroflexota bacterium]|nr:hypothetical protein [Chloroflexota bacterium]